jgi:hypothetical protein
MNDNAMIERWNPIDSAKMAVSVKSVLYRLLNGRKPPFDSDEALDEGIAFLKEAQSGGAIICGSPETSDFTGTLSPLRLSTAIYLSVTSTEQEEREVELYKKIVDTLKSYKKLLENAKEAKSILEAETRTAEDALKFFENLSNALIKQTDPTSESYSRELQEAL